MIQNTRNSHRFPSVWLIVGVASATVVPAVRVYSTHFYQTSGKAPQRVALSSSERETDDDVRGGDQGGCCQPGGLCTVETEPVCTGLAGVWLGLATNCKPNCCAVANPTGSDCACATSTCVVDAGQINTPFSCDPANGNADCDVGQTCTLQCTPTGVTQLRHPYECYDDLGAPLEPTVECDPANGHADCVVVDPLAVCQPSFVLSTTTTRSDTIESTFGFVNGDRCTLSSLDRVGWYELITLEDSTPGDGTDDCFILTVGLCCTDPVLTPVWQFLSSFRNCPCVWGAGDLIAIAPDFDSGGDPLDGFGPTSKARAAGRCEDDNYSATFTLPPGDYAYQIRADKTCEGSSISCDDADDCPEVVCVVANPDYTVHFTVESCPLGACCVGETCIPTNELDCAAQAGTFLPGLDCVSVSCGLGSCCVDGQCSDDVDADTLAECDALGGVYMGGVDCSLNPCPACPFNSPANCQQVQTIFGPVPFIDRNPENGTGTLGVVLADDVKFGGGEVDTICWNAGFFATPCCGTGCAQNVDTTWQIRIYETDPGCDAIPGTEVGMSTITVLNKVEGTGQATATWHYSGSLDSPIALPSGGFGGDTYWFEVSGFGDEGCEVRAIWSRDDGNEHSVAAQIATENEARIYDLVGIGDFDVGFCENSGILSPGDVLGACCTCPTICQDDFTQRECDDFRGDWLACATCAETACPGAPANDNCETPFLVSNVPESLDGLDVLTISNQNNICANDDGPGLNSSPLGGCLLSLGYGGADMHNDVWYAYTATNCGDLRIESCGSDMDQMIAVYHADNGCPLTDAEELACDDDTCGIVSGPADVTLRVVEGQDYLIRVGGWNDEVAGGFHGDPRGTFDLNWSLTFPDCHIGPPGPAAGSVLTNRYLAINPQPDGPGSGPAAFHISVEVDSTEIPNHARTHPDLVGTGVWWATDAVGENGLGTETCLSVLSRTQPASPPDFSACPTVYLTGCPIVPTTTYAIHSWWRNNPSSTLLLGTQAKPGVKWYGDCVGQFSGPPDNVWGPPNGVVNADDFVACIKTFQGPNAPNATHLSVSDIEPLRNGTQVNLLVNINDVFAIIQGFRGFEYNQDEGGPDLTQCP